MNISVDEEHDKWYIRLQNRWHWSSPGDYWTDYDDEAKAFESEDDAREFLERNRRVIEGAS